MSAKKKQDEDTVIKFPDRVALAAESTGLVERAKGFKIENATDHEEGLVIFKNLKSAWKVVDDKLKPIIEQAHKTHKSLTSLRAELFAPIDEALKILERKCIAFSDEQRRIAEEKQRALQAKVQQEEEERALMDAIDAEQAGDKVVAEEILATPVEAPLVHVMPAVATVSGISEPERWSFVVKDPAQILKAVLETPHLKYLIAKAVEALQPDLNRMAVSQRKALQIPGGEAVMKRGLSARTA